MLKHAGYLVLAICIILNSRPATFALAGEIDQFAKTYLEGVWLLGKRPDQGPCVSADYDGATQWGFEFEKTGGRLMHYEPQDFFSPVMLERIERNGDALSLWIRGRSGEAISLGRIRLLPPDRFEMLKAEADNGVQLPEPKDGDAPSEAAVAYRCGILDRSVTGDVPISNLALLTPLASAPSAMFEVQPGVPDADVCSRRSGRRWLKLDVLGPAHFYAMGLGFQPEHRLDLDLIRKVEILEENVFRLTLQEHSGRRKGWESKGGRTYQLTATAKDGRIDIPELSATFIRCDHRIP